MCKIYMEYINGCFDENDVAEINQIYNTNDVCVEFYERPPCVVNAALDELVETVLLFINSDELQTLISISSIATSIGAAVQWMRNKLKSKKKIKVTSHTVEETDSNIIVQVDNVKILLDKNATEDELAKYLRIALVEAKRVVNTEIKPPIVIDGDNNTVNMYYLEDFAKKKHGLAHKTIRSLSHRKYGRRRL